jgi:dihydrolipoamide dehydrogenase
VRQGHFRFSRRNQGVLEYGVAPPTHIQFKSCVLATGSRPSVLPQLTPDGVRIVDSTGVLALKDVPERVVVVGAGYIGVELGTAMRKLGSEVTMVEMAARLLPTLPDAVAAPVARRLRQLGIDVRTGAQVVADDGRAVTVRGAGGEETVKADIVIVAVGRVPNTDDLGLDALGVTPGKGGLLEVGPDRLLTPQVAAIGDITPGPALAHKANAEANVAVEVLSGRKAVFDPAAIPAVVFSDPEVAVTGLSLQEAQARGIDAALATFPVAASGRARTLNELAGFTQLVHTVDDGIVIGAQLVGPHASDCVTEASLAIEMGATLIDVAHTIHPHPTMSETVMEAALVGEGRPVHVAPRRR